MNGKPAGGGTIFGVVVGAGRGTRFGAAKQFADLAGRTVVERAVDALAGRPNVAGVVVVLPAEEAGGERGAGLGRHPGVTRVIAGGATRAESVLRGVRAVEDATHVLVHDAARPRVSGATVDAVAQATLLHGAAIPGLEVDDTVKEVDEAGVVRATLDRRRLRLAQTPQGSRIDWLLAALERAQRDGVAVSDEAAALERSGHPVHVVAGDPGNVKITRPEDLGRAAREIDAEAGELRVGTGFDVHRFGDGRRLVLGGVEFPGEPGLTGHSDADVVLHAVMDALLGAAGLGDIGIHFPPGDPRFAGADSRDLTARVRTLVDRAGFAPVNVDVTVLAERPRIGPRADDLRRSLAACLGLGPDRVGLKATTLEGLGALGRSEGIACQAVALIRRVLRG